MSPFDKVDFFVQCPATEWVFERSYC